MVNEKNKSCKCPISCNRHGDCAACRDYHKKNKSKIFCEMLNIEKVIFRDNARIKKATSIPFPKIPDVTLGAFKSALPFHNVIKDLANPAGLMGFSNKIENVTYAANQIYKAFLPNLQNILGIGSSIAQVFEKQMKNQYYYKQEIVEKWNNLETELKTKNRYFPQSDLINIFEKCIVEAKFILPKGKILYRARKYNIDELSTDVSLIIKRATERFNDYQYQKLPDKEKDIWDYIINIPYYDWEQQYLKELNIPKIDFWGYNSILSDAPPSSKTIPGRANPVGISYLYTSNSIATAISEIQPTIGQLISVGKIKTLKELNFFNFNFYEAFKNSEFMEKSLVEIKEKNGISFEEMKVFFDTISKLYSKPSLGYTDNYYATQYISEFIKNKGFDGIIFNSSLKKKGINYVLFDTSKDDTSCPNNYKIVSSSLHKINNISISEETIFPKRNKPNHKL